jgi:hypothetical protein
LCGFDQIDRKSRFFHLARVMPGKTIPAEEN